MPYRVLYDYWRFDGVRIDCEGAFVVIMNKSTTSVHDYLTSGMTRSSERRKLLTGTKGNLKMCFSSLLSSTFGFPKKTALHHQNKKWFTHS
jgi:hypothetical protein